MGALLDFAEGTRFGRLTFIRRVRIGSQLRCVCRCDCGTETTVTVGKLTTGATKSCGCLRKRVGSEASAYKHGHAVNGRRSPTMTVWSNMIDRCTRNSHVEWHNYGGRGIKVCKRWLTFENFLQDMGERPGLQYRLERINNNAGYSPKNCRWATQREQMRNTRHNHFVDVDGTRICQKDAADLLGVPRDRLKRLERHGFKLSTQDASFLQNVHMNGRLITFRGKTQSVTHWALEIGISRNALYSRLRRGWTIERALTVS